MSNQPQTDLGPVCVCGHLQSVHANEGTGACGALDNTLDECACHQFRLSNNQSNEATGGYIPPLSPLDIFRD